MNAIHMESIEGKNGQIVVRKPRTGKRFPAVILVQGFGMTLHEYKNSHDELSVYLAERGFLTLQFDFSYEKRRTQKADREISLTKRAGEVNDVREWTLGYAGADPHRVGILSMSFGVSTVLLSDLSGIGSLCFVSGIGFRPQAFISRYIAKGAVINKTGETTLPRSSGRSTFVGADFWDSFDEFRQEDHVQKITVPTLVVYGEHDPYIAREDTEAVIGSIPEGKQSVKYFPGGDHGIINVTHAMRREFLSLVGDWFTKTL